MRVAIGFLAANALLLIAGTGVLLGIGVLRLRLRAIAAAAGLSFIVGLALVMLLGICMLVVGIPVRFLTLAAICLVLGGWGLLAATRREDWRGFRTIAPKLTLRPRAWNWRTASPVNLTFAVVLLALAVFIGVAVSYYKVAPAATFDDFAIWSKKALALYYFDDLNPAFFINSTYLPMHQEYPILLPLLEAFVFRAMGRPDTQLIHVEFLVFFVAFLGALAYLTYRESRHFLWVPVLVAVAVAPFVHVQLVTGYADIPMSCFVAVGMLSLALWLEQGERWQLGLAVILFAAAGSTKFEGLIAAAVAFGAAGAIVILQRRWQALAAAGVGVAALAVLLLPWRLWVIAHPAIQSFFHPSRGFDPHYLSSHSELPGEALKLISANIADTAQSFYIVPIALAFVVFALLARRARVPALFYLAVSLLLLAALVWIYWVDPTTWSPNRVADSVILIAVSAILHLSSRVPVSEDLAASFGPGRIRQLRARDEPDG
jgi:hypothetical protein